MNTRIPVAWAVMFALLAGCDNSKATRPAAGKTAASEKQKPAAPTEKIVTDRPSAAQAPVDAPKAPEKAPAPSQEKPAAAAADEAQEKAAAADPAHLGPNEAAARDALVRFVSFAKADHLWVAPNPLLGDVLPTVPGCKLELISRDDLVARHKGERRSPMIVAVTANSPDVNDPTKGPITVLVALEMAAIEGFEEVPDGIGREYVYEPTGTGVHFVKEQGWVE